jgi:hypothetical protein
MKGPRIVSAGVALACLLATLFALRLSGANGRDFAGFYQTSNVTQQGDSYQLTFKARVFNYSGADITGATFLLMRADQLGPAYATFPGISITKNQSTVVSSSIALSSRDYQAWQKGAPPRLFVQFTDSQGQNRREPVQLAWGPVR